MSNRLWPESNRCFGGCKFVYWKDIDASLIQKHLADLRCGKDGIIARTSNYYLASIKQFCRWIVRNQKASESPVEHLSKVNVNKGQQVRRALEPDEIRRLLEAAEAAPIRFDTAGHQRAVLYRLAVETGLRAKELRSLTVSSFDLEKCTVTARADDTKNSTESILPLRKDTAELLRTFLSGKLPGAKAFAMPCKYRMADMIRADCKDARIDCEDSGQGKIDFHSLRHTTGSLLAASGVHPKVAQSIMRHSDINLTMSRYTHIFRGQESEAVAKLPDLSLPSKQSQKATGTDDLKVGGAYKPAYEKLAKNAYADSDPMSSIGPARARERLDTRRDGADSKSLQMSGLGTEREPMSANDTSRERNTPGRTRTCDLRIRNPLLYPTELRAQSHQAAEIYQLLTPVVNSVCPAANNKAGKSAAISNH